jgi:hypothetical protein
MAQQDQPRKSLSWDKAVLRWINEFRAKDRGRAQPAGWDKAVLRLLKPEHFRRVSDTQVEITLPAIPDFDIEEDEIVPVRVPAFMLSRSTVNLDAGVITIKADSFEERIDNALVGLREEREQLGASSELASFLLTFFTCEIAAKAIVSHVRYGRAGRKALSDKWSTRDVLAALAALGIASDVDTIGALFSTEHAVASEMSAKALRDSIVHRMKDTHRRAVRARFVELMQTMERFLDLIAAWRKQSAGTSRVAGR